MRPSTTAGICPVSNTKAAAFAAVNVLPRHRTGPTAVASRFSGGLCLVGVGPILGAWVHRRPSLIETIRVFVSSRPLPKPKLSASCSTLHRWPRSASPHHVLEPFVASIYKLRPAVTDDIAALRSFRCADRGERYTREVEALIRTDVADLVDDAVTFVHVAATVDGIVAVIAYGPVPMGIDADDAMFIYALGVVPEHRRQFLATLLKQHVFDHARTTGLTSVVSQVHRRNTAMRALNSTLDVVVRRDPSDGDYLLSVARLR